MEVTKTLHPGERGAARLLRRYSERLVCVRYRFDPARNKNVTTVELIVDERDAPEGHSPLDTRKPAPKQQVLLRIDFEETVLRERVKQANGRWDPERCGWVLPYARVQELGLEERIIQEHVPISGHTGTGDG